MGKAQGRMNCSFIMMHLGTEGAPREGMVGITGDLDRFLARNLNQKAAGVRAIIGAHGSLNFASQGKPPHVTPTKEFFYDIDPGLIYSVSQIGSSIE
jgi:hypothetical protein